MTVRLAETEQEILHCAEMFEQFYSAASMADIAEFDARSALTTLLWLVQADEGTLLYHESGGMLGGIAAPLPFNNNRLLAQELFWWVEPGARKTGAGMELLQEFERWAAQRGAVAIQMLALEQLNPEVVGQMYTQSGYVPSERAFMKVN